MTSSTQHITSYRLAPTPPHTCADASSTCHPTVLIVDDHDLVGTALALSLRAAGIHADRLTVRSRQGVLDEAAKRRPGIVLLDLDLGEDETGGRIDGVSLVYALRTGGWRVLALSGTADAGRIGAALQSGALAWIPKRAPLPNLLATVHRAAEGTPVMSAQQRQSFIDVHLQQQAEVRSTSRKLGRLSERERAVLDRLAKGTRAQSIAEEFYVTLATIRSQIRSILHKLEVKSQLEAVALLHRHRRSSTSA
jgi:DNA-binding NarL/FixJ family response regulator